MIDYAEKRDFIRMPVQCPISMRGEIDRDKDTAELLDLSATGMRFLSRQAIQEGARLQITVHPENPITPPLEAEVSVIRCQAIDNGFDIAAAIENIEPPSVPVLNED